MDIHRVIELLDNEGNDYESDDDIIYPGSDDEEFCVPDIEWCRDGTATCIENNEVEMTQEDVQSNSATSGCRMQDNNSEDDNGDSNNDDDDDETHDGE
jgi:hypothetical protein